MSHNGAGSKFCEQCGAALASDLKFCEACGAPATPDRVQTTPPPVRQAQAAPAADPGPETRPGRARRVLTALGLVACVFIAIAWWSLSQPGPPPLAGTESPGPEDPYAPRQAGVDSINNTIDGQKVAIGGHGHVMQSPGLGVRRPVWVLLGPAEYAFTIGVGETEGGTVFSPGFQVLLPTLTKVTAGTGRVAVRVDLAGQDGSEQVLDLSLAAENRWQPLALSFTYDPEQAPYRLRFEARGFEGPMYIDRPSAPLESR